MVPDAGHHSGLWTKAGEDVRSRRRRRSAHSWIVDRQSRLVGEQPQGRRGVRGPSAKSGRGRQSLDQSEAAEPHLSDLRRERACGAQHQILVDRASLERPRTEDLENQIAAGLERNPVAQPGKRHEALEFMIAIGPAPNHAQRQIDLRGRAPPSHWA